MTNGEDNAAEPAVPQVADAALVVRSNVPPGLQYTGYRKYLRNDFFYSCAYCTMSEAEATAIRFAIDHYEPIKARPDLQHDYANLMYCCDACNQRKGDRCPPGTARADGYRFFRPDQDTYRTHFRRSGLRLEPLTKVGYFSIHALDLNRQPLRRLRELRDRLTKCDELVVDGILALRRFRFDQLPPSVKGSATRAIAKAISVSNQIADEIDAVLRDYARSPLIDDDPAAADDSKARAAKLKELHALYPGNWRAPRDRK